MARVSPLLSQYIHQLSENLKNHKPQCVNEIIPAYRSLTVCFDPLIFEHKIVEEQLEKVIAQSYFNDLLEANETLIKIPVCYQGDFASDLAFVAETNNLTCEQVIERHTKPTYLVNMLGFLPGFLYLSGLDESLHTARKAIPALQVEAGAIGIGGGQTGIYPFASPGGWHIIGQTPVKIFKPESDTPFIAKPMDHIQFVPIDEAEFQRIARSENEFSGVDISEKNRL